MKITILGSTGSIGRQSVDVALFMGYRVEAIAFSKDIKTGEEQIRLLEPSLCAVFDEAAGRELAVRVADTKTRVVYGEEGVIEAASLDGIDVVINAIVGMAGLRPTLSAIEHTKRLALANKESLVCAGDIVMKRIKERGVELLPVDSEHSAVFRCLRSGDNGGFKKLILTASGGPFYNKTAEELKDKGVKETLAHPTWSMGAKITVDSATLMNKGFEVIEAFHIFNPPPDKIEVVVHRQSIVHSMVELPDGAVIAQLSVPDMRECIQYALTYPEIKPSKLESLDFSKIGALTFDKYDGGTFPLLDFACRCFRRGGVIPSVLNGANEEAVSAFLKGSVKYPAIAETVMKITEDFENLQDPDAEEIIGAGLEARRRAAELLR